MKWPKWYKKQRRKTNRTKGKKAVRGDIETFSVYKNDRPARFPVCVLAFFIIWPSRVYLWLITLFCKILGESLLISLSNGCCSIKCQSFKRICFKFGTAGWYCVRKGKIRFVCSEKSQSLAFKVPKKRKLCLCSYKICTLKYFEIWFRSFRALGKKLRILRTLKVGLFCSQKWSEDCVEFQVVTSRWCQKFVYSHSVLAASKDCRKSKTWLAILWTIDSGNSLC